MLKSHYNLQPPDEEEHATEEGVHEEDEDAKRDVDEELINQSIYPERLLNKSEISLKLSMLGKTAEGDCYTYLKAACTGMNLTNISALVNFKHLQFVDVSKNYLNLASLDVLSKLEFLVLIQADNNILQSAALSKMKYLQVIIMNNNMIKSVHDVFQPELCTLEVAYNKIERANFENKMPTIKCLDFRYNMLSDIADLVDFPKLDSLYLAGNKIKSLEGLERLENLRILHLRNNPIKKLDGFGEGQHKLQYVNLRNCKVRSLGQLRKLRVLTGLETLILKGTPYMGGTGEEQEGGGPEEEDDSELRVEVLATLMRLKRLNKAVFTPEERTEAIDLMKTWLEEGEKEDEDVEEEGNPEEQQKEDEL